MKRICTLLIILILIFPVKTYAADGYTEKINEITEQFTNNTDILNISVSDVFDYLKNTVADNISAPLRISVKMLVVILVYSTVRALYENRYGAYAVYDKRCTAIVFINLLTPLKNITDMISENLFSVKNFMISFLPVYAGISMASGEVFSSQIYTGFFLSAIIFISTVCINVIIPSVKFYFSIIISDTLSSYIRLGKLRDFYIKTIKLIMSVSVSVICFILTLQTAITGSKDTLAVKAGKIFSSAAIPVIGSALQEAVNSVYSGMETIKGFAGASGLLAVMSIFAPSLIILAIYYFFTNILYILADIFDAQSISKCLKGYIDVIQLISSVVVLYVIMLIFAITIMISITNGV